MFGTCGSPCTRKFGWFGGGGKNHVCSKTGLSYTKWPLRNAMIFSTTSKSPQFSHTWSLAQTKLGFQDFIFFEFILPSRLTGQTISLYLKGALESINFSKFSFTAMFGICGSPCKRKFGWFGGGGKNDVCTKTGLSPNGPSGMRWFFRPPPNHLYFGTHDLLHKQS